ncbi:hypothetical protein RRG08_041177 [Elysia crispata]|uniref:Uncharacterized protein n=1 Tax=Elysia crispata TaxID=231223 RepID=A0AAE1CPC2_9GAST|nr:hypothetical protein RRG08_041177 [Elysia crispata]
MDAVKLRSSRGMKHSPRPLSGPRDAARALCTVVHWVTWSPSGARIFPEFTERRRMYGLTSERTRHFIKRAAGSPCPGLFGRES